jgi:Ran GTPase-activating protein (RanGAP) involved in mRNA processing and transport
VKRFSKVGEILEIFEVRFSKKNAGRVVAEIYAGSVLLMKGALRIYKRVHHIDLEDFVVTTGLFDRDLGIEIPRVVTKLGRDYF